MRQFHVDSIVEISNCLAFKIECLTLLKRVARLLDSSTLSNPFRAKSEILVDAEDFPKTLVKI